MLSKYFTNKFGLKKINYYAYNSFTSYDLIEDIQNSKN